MLIVDVWKMAVCECFMSVFSVGEVEELLSVSGMVIHEDVMIGKAEEMLTLPFDYAELRELLACGERVYSSFGEESLLAVLDDFGL